MGNKEEDANPFQWDHVLFNLPGSEDYDPSLPWVAKIRTDGEISSDIFLYIDDCRITGANEEVCWRAARRFGSRCNYLGIQDAARKRKEPDLKPGPWAGTVTHTAEGVVGKISQEKWEKTKVLIQRLHVLVEENEKQLPRAELESI